MIAYTRNRLPVGHAGAWTFIETLIVIGIILILTASVGFMAFKYMAQAKQATAKSQIETFSVAMNSLYLDAKKFPSAEQGLKSLWQNPSLEGWNGPYISKDVPKDPWGNDYIFKVPGPNGLPFEILSLGGDNVEGGEGENADISSAK